MRSLTIAPSFEDVDYLSAFWRNDPDHGRIVTRQDGSILYAENRTERIVAASNWNMTAEELRDFADATGGEYSYISPGSFAYSLFRRRFAPAYQWASVGSPTDFRAELTRAAIIGGRCEMYTAVENVPLFQLDIRSAYPYAALDLRMPDPLSYRRATDPSIRNIERYEGTAAAIVSQDGMIPYLPHRTWISGDPTPHVIYPIMERAYGIWSHTELRAAMAAGVTVHLVDKQYIADRYLPSNPYQSFVAHCWDRRTAGDHARAWKTIVNAFFGRLAGGHSGLWVWTLHNFAHPATYDTFSHMDYYGAACDRAVFSPRSDANHLHAAMILAHARERLYSLIRLGAAYCDTDCAMFPNLPPNLPIPIGGGWGELSLQYGNYTIKGQKAYITRKDGGGYRIVLRGVARAGRNVEDFFAASGTNERIPVNKLETIPHTVIGSSCSFPRSFND